MTLKELSNKVEIGVCLSGQFNVTIIYHGKRYSCKSNNTLAYDRYKGSDDVESDKAVWCNYTLRQALQSLYEECKRKNNLH